MLAAKDFLPLPPCCACRNRHPSAAPSTLETVFLPHPFSPRGTCALSVLASEIWELLNKTISIFYLLFSLTALCSISTISLDTASPKWLGKNEHLPTRGNLSSLDENLCYPFSFSSKFLWRLSRPPWLRDSWVLKASSAPFSQLFPPPLLLDIQFITQKARFAFWQKCFPLGVPCL